MGKTGENLRRKAKGSFKWQPVATKRVLSAGEHTVPFFIILAKYFGLRLLFG